MTSGAPTILRERYVAFIDILGFSHQVDLMRQGDGAAVARAWRALARLDELENGWRQLRQRPAAGVSEFHVTAFSDSIVISDDAPFGIVASAQHLIVKLLEQGLLCRGGIARGPTYHRDRVVFGPGMIDAYELERRAAVLPRVVVAPEVALELGGNMIDGSQFFAMDADGLCYVKPFMRVSNVRTGGTTLEEAERESFVRLAEMIRSQTPKDPHSAAELSIYSKWTWIAARLKEAVEERGFADVS